MGKLHFALDNLIGGLGDKLQLDGLSLKGS